MIEVIKLNLGCGKKQLNDYINIDVIQRDGVQPDIICDVSNKLPFINNFADEILSVHLIEHIDRWKVDSMLAEWIRVLKPGGRLVIECPNLIEACKNIINGPKQNALHDKRGQHSMWPLYGDPNHGDPYMMHRWGYTPYSLMILMENHGLKNVRQTKCQFKKREPRDMRIEGIKKQ